MFKNTAPIVVAALSTLLAGCTVRLTDFTVLSTQNVDLVRLGTYPRAPERAKGESSVPVLIFPLGQPNVKEAVDNAIRSVPGGVALVNGVVYYEFFYFIFGVQTYRVEGDVLIDPQLVQQPAAASKPSPTTSRD